MSRLTSVHGRQVLDSRGRPTVEVDVELASGSTGRASVPSGASTGSFEAHELRDGDPEVYAGLGVTRAVRAVTEEIGPAVRGLSADAQQQVDAVMRDLDGTPNLARLGANAVLGVSLAVCRAAAAEQRVPLHRRIADLAGVAAPVLPVPMVNILSGGLHAGRGMDVQDFLVVPTAAATFADALHVVERVRAAGATALVARGLPTLLADEGGLSPACQSGTQALELMVEIFERAGLEPGREATIAIDVAAHSLAVVEGTSRSYVFGRERVTRSTDQVVDLMADWVESFPVVSIEDALDEDDWEGWVELTRRLGDRTALIGDDLFTTSTDRLRRGIETGAGNGVLVKVNQNGTLTGTLEVVSLARSHGFVPVVSARSGETEDSFLADLAVGTAAGQIKVGSVRTSDRLAKYNQLLRIAEDPTIPLASAPRARTAGSVA